MAPKQLSTLDMRLPLWIGRAMIGGLLLGRFIPAALGVLSRAEVGRISAPIVLGPTRHSGICGVDRADRAHRAERDLAVAIVRESYAGLVRAAKLTRNMIPVTHDAVRAADVVVATGRGDACPFSHGVTAPARRRLRRPRRDFLERFS
jgi:hypothetical protein